MARPRSRRKPPPPPRVTSLTRDARRALVQADVLALEAARAKVPQVSKGIFGSRTLRAAGDISRYFPGPGAVRVPKPPKPPKGGRQRRR